MTITSERPDTELDIVPDEEDMSGINIQTFVDQQVTATANLSRLTDRFLMMYVVGFRLKK